MDKVYVFLANGFEEVEGLTVVDILRRAGADVKTVSITGDLRINGSHGIGVIADELFDEEKLGDGDMFVLPGGMPGTLYLGEHDGLGRLLLNAKKAGKKIAAICAAPGYVLGQLRDLEGVRFTCFDGCGNLRTLSLPATLASVGDYAFSGCNANIEVTYDGAPSMWTQVEKGEDIGFSDSSIQFSCMASGTQGDLLAWDISNSGVLTISGTDGIWNYAENDPAPWADYADRVTGLVICEGVRSIGTDAFIGFTGITEVAVPSTVGFIGLHAFDGCSGLTTLSLPAGLELIESYAFRGCALTTVNYNGSPSMWAQIEKGTEIGISDDVLRFAFAADGTEMVSTFIE